MYRIELSPGEETAFRSIEELAVAIRRGVVTSKARIWHNASSKWLPIQFHPHYKAASEMPLTQADLVAGPPVAPLSALSLPDPSATAPRVTGFRPIDPSPKLETPAPAPRVTPFKPASPYHEPEPHLPPAPIAGLPLIEPLGSMSSPAPVKPEPVRPLPPRPQPVLPFVLRPVPSKAPAMKVTYRVEEPARKRKKEKRSRRNSSRRALRVAFIGALLVGGAHLAISASAALRPETLRSHRRLVAAPPEVSKTDSPRTVAAVIPTLRNSSVPGGAGLPHGAAQPRPALRTPAPTLGAVTRASLPAMTPPNDSNPEIQAAPTVDMPVPAPAATDSLTSSARDSTGKKVLKGILRAVSGSSTSEPTRPKR